MGQLFRREVFQHRQHRLSGNVILIQPPLFKALTLLILTMTIAALVFLSIGSYTRKETVVGILQPNLGVIKLAAPQQGIVAEVLVKEGQTIEKDQPILRIRSEKQGLEGFELNQSLINQYRWQLTQLNQQQLSLKQQHQLQLKALADEKQSLAKQQEQLNAQNQTFTKRLTLNQQIVEQIDQLAGTGYISELDLKRQQDSIMALEQQASAIKSQILANKLNIEQVDSQLAQLPLEQQQALDQIEQQIQQVQGQLGGIQQQQISELRAPAAGVVTGLLAISGKAVNAQQNLLSILPQNSIMQAILYVPTSAFGFIDQGQNTQLRYHAFPYQRFGIHQGVISQISNNVILPEEADIPGIITSPSYRIVVDLDAQSIKAYGRDMPLRSGMKLDADIIIEKRSLLRWLFDPIFSLRG